MDEPQLRLYMQDHAAPASYYEHARRPLGRGAVLAFAKRHAARLTVWAVDGTLARRRAEELAQGELSIRSPMSVGIAGGQVVLLRQSRRPAGGSAARRCGQPRVRDRAACEPLEIAGDAALELTFTVDKPVAQVAVRLVDVAPDGAATRVSYGLLNLTHRDSHETPKNWCPGKTYTARVPFKHVAQTLSRRATGCGWLVSTSYFPLAWPAPEPATLTLDIAATRLILPVRGPDRRPRAARSGQAAGHRADGRPKPAARRSADWTRDGKPCAPARRGSRSPRTAAPSASPTTT